MTLADVTLHTMIFRCGWTPRGVSGDHICRFADAPPAPTRSNTPAGKEVAIAGPDGQRAADLLATAKRAGAGLLASLTEKAVRRLLAMADQTGTIPAAPVLFDDDELKELQSSLAATIATADLLGRSRVKQFVAKMQEREQAAASIAKFAEGPNDPPDHEDPFHPFPEPIPFQPPVEAIAYFQRLVPTLGNDPYRYGALLERHAFTLAVAVDQALLDKVKRVISDRLLGQEPIGTATADIQDILDAAGVAPANPQYAEMVYRTNMMDAYNAGQQAEIADPAMQEFFPWWRYDGILDSRTGDDHRPKIGKYYPASAAFADVRGPRVWNCRCCMTPLYRTDVRDLMAKGVRAETAW